ncbi:MAG: PAS domain S-box protein [Oscillospiraceae bacterium]|nr:PAS domain S-box protein [Oscillospiraceae bacterium]
MLEEIRGQVLNTMPIGYALHRIVVDDTGTTCDYEFIDANSAFAKVIGMTTDQIIGRRVTQILPDIIYDEFNWIEAYSQVALLGKKIGLEQYSQSLNKWYSVTAFSPKHGYFVTLVSDITDEKARNKTLSESNKLLSDFLNSSSDMIFLKDDQLRYVYANQTLSNFLNMLPEDIIGKDDFSILPTAFSEICKESDLEVINSNSRITTEETIFDKTFETLKFPISYPDGAFGIGAFIKDITSRKRQEDSLKKQLYRQSILVDVYSKNFQSRQELLDYTLHKALELTGSQYGYIYLYDEGNCEFTLNSWTIGVMANCEVIDKKTKYQLENTGIWGEVVRQRSPIVVNDMAKPSSLKKGYPDGHVKLKNFLSVPIIVDEIIVAVAGLGNKSTDYTDLDVNEMIILVQSAWLAVEKKSAQIQTIKEREKYQSILNELPALICEFLPDATLTFVNKEYCSYFGLSQESLSEKFLDFMPHDERNLASQNYLKLTPFERTIDYELNVMVNDKPRWQRWHDIGIFDSQGLPLRYCSIGFDITEQKYTREKMERLLAQMYAMFNEHEAVMLLVDPVTGKIIDANPSASRFYGYKRAELLDMSTDDINQLSKEDVSNKRLQILNKKCNHFTFPHKLKNEQIRIVDVYSSPISYNNQIALFSIIFDVTDREEAIKEIANKQALLSSLINATPDLIFFKNKDGVYLGCNKAFSEFVGKSENQIIGQTDFDLFGKELASQFNKMDIEMLKLNQSKRNEEVVTTANGSEIFLETLKSPYYNNNGELVGLIGISRDITERKKREAEIEYISYHDYLTGAYNRRFFEEEFERLNSQSNYPIAVVMGDVNGLKLINDSFGHHFGDKLLQDIVKRISACLRPGDISARIGGDEFGIILPRTNETEANAIVSQIKSTIEKESDINTSETALMSVSFGFAVQTVPGVGLGALMKQAEGYMFNKKFYDSRSLKGRTIDIVMKTLFEKSPREKLHSERVGNISAAIAKELGFDKERINKIRVAGFLHDIGKIGIPENILNKKSKLDAQEWKIMKTHPEKSRRILENTYEYSEISNIVLYHHEKWNGSGYPEGLMGVEIPLESRIVAVADAYDAMTYNRSYRTKSSLTDAIEELRRCSATHFDPAIVEIFIEKVLSSEIDFL